MRDGLVGMVLGTGLIWRIVASISSVKDRIQKYAQKYAHHQALAPPSWPSRKPARPASLVCSMTPTCAPSTLSVWPSCPRTSSSHAVSVENVLNFQSLTQPNNRPFLRPPLRSKRDFKTSSTQKYVICAPLFPCWPELTSPTSDKGSPCYLVPTSGILAKIGFPYFSYCFFWYLSRIGLPNLSYSTASSGILASLASGQARRNMQSVRSYFHVAPATYFLLLVLWPTLASLTLVTAAASSGICPGMASLILVTALLLLVF